MKENNAEKQIKPEYYGFCAADISTQLLDLDPKLHQLKMELIKAEMGANFALVDLYTQANGRAVANYYRLLGLKEGLECVANNQDPKPLVEKILSDVNTIFEHQGEK